MKIKKISDLPSPVPAAGIDAYNNERELALAYSNRRRENYKLYQRSNRRSSKVDYLPIKLDIENVSRCNFRCSMCVVSEWDKGRRAEDMSFDDFKRIIDEQYGLVEIKLQGVGEPSMQGDTFFKMIRYARAQNIWVRTTTNASLLHLRDNYKKFIDSDPNEIQISIDGADKLTFELIREGSRFDKVCENCKLINSYSRDQGVIRTKMWTVVQKDNENQLEALVDLAGELGFTNQVFALNLGGWASEEWEQRNYPNNVDDSLDAKRLWGLVDRGISKGVAVSFWSNKKIYSAESIESLCPWPFERAVVSSDLRNVPCCLIGDPDTFELSIGENLVDAWNSDEYESFRENHINGKIPEICKTCYNK